ncbi:GMC family oxidoreductase [Rhodococcus sp. SBT000017]|uniref:GMC family oxidoreductase n=1 Tax=Rhodococcus sp. SBT000017 TaxID=1803385 RepID=UPI00217CC95D|nr:GMC family oxidoreductase N-terminal domain-containing protein [Rhodococcus sp. SBT000017]
MIVGAGSSGCVLAARLSEDPRVSVALVEAGGADSHPDITVPLSALELLGSEVDWDYVTEPQSGLGGRAVSWPRGRVIGGSSSINFQMWVPGHPADFDSWPENWSAEKVAPYFRRAERWSGPVQEGRAFGTRGPLWISPQRDPDPSTHLFLEACESIGIHRPSGGLGAIHNVGCALTPVTQHYGARWSSADGYLKPVLGRPNLTVLSSQTAQCVLFDGSTATGVRLEDFEVAARREVVLSAGSVGSPHLLMLSGIGPAKQLQAVGIEPLVDLPVGLMLQDHTILDLAVNAAAATRFLGVSRERYEQKRMGPLTSNIGEGVAFLRADGGDGPPDLELIWSPIAFDSAGLTIPGYTLGVVLLRPESRGIISLASSDPNSRPYIDPRYLTAPADVSAYLAGLKVAKKILDALGDKHDGPVDPWPSDDSVIDYIRDRASTVFHPIGSCAIGSVVDDQLRVYGTTKMRVVDASVIPSAPRGHTHAHAVMIAERAADLIRA